jgi:hypothetical protein
MQEDRLVTLLNLVEKKAAGAQHGTLALVKFKDGWQVGVYDVTGGTVNVFQRGQPLPESSLAAALEAYLITRP